MEGSLRYNRRKSGYEPSDTETEAIDTPRREAVLSENVGFDQNGGKGSFNGVNVLQQSGMVDIEAPFSGSARRRHSISPYKSREEHGNILPTLRNTELLRNASSLSRKTYSDIPRNLSPFSKYERGTNPDGFTQSERRTNPENYVESANPFSVSHGRAYVSSHRNGGEVNGLGYVNHDASRGREKNAYIRRAASAPRTRLRERGRTMKQDEGENIKGGWVLSPIPQEVREDSYKHGSPVDEINEMVKNAKFSSKLDNQVQNFESTDSISPGDIFFSRDYNGFQDAVFSKNNGLDPSKSLPMPPGFVVVNRNPRLNQAKKVNANLNHNARKMSQTTNSSSVVSRQSSNISDNSGLTSSSAKKFVSNRQKSHTDAWSFCIKIGSCRTARKSPKKDRPFDEASFIGKAVVVESLRPFWADKHRPASLAGFTCHKQEAQFLQQLTTSEIFPHVLFKGLPGSGRKSLIMALLREVYGDAVWNMSHDLRYFHIMESRPMQIVVPISSSPCHVELNVYLEPKAAYALTALVKEISSKHAISPEISTTALKAEYKVLVLYDVDKASENIHHLMKWIMDCYSDSCKLVLCCEDDVDILESVKGRCKIIKVEAPVTHEVMEVLIQIAKKEGFELPMNFAAKIATKSKQNLRRAIMALEACKAHNYPFLEDQPIPLGWEESVIELAADILEEPLPKRLFFIQGKVQKLLGDFVHPRLILLKLVEQLLQGIESKLKRELYYWYSYYDKRLPSGMSALLKLEEFVAKFMSMYRKSYSFRRMS